MASDLQLSDVLSEFARTMVTDFPIQAILDRLVESIVEVLPVTAAGVTLISPGPESRDVAASDVAALRFERLQTELGEGPCFEAYRTGKAIAVADLREEQRFPTFARRARVEGLMAVFTFPLRHGDSQLGALDLYRDAAGPLEAPVMAAAQTFADVAAAYLLNAQARVELSETPVPSRETSLRDALTGLPNRTLLLEHLEHAIQRSGGSGKSVAVLFVDLAGLKAVNDTRGHRVGDELLIAVADRVWLTLRPGDTLGRVSGDELVILCEDLDEPSEAAAIAARVRAQLELPFVLSDADLHLTASVSVAFSGPVDHFPEQLVHRGVTAISRTMQRGSSRHQALDLRERRLADRQASLTHDLARALSRDELRLVYQPIVAAGDGHLLGVEALLRWTHPHRGTISPTAFMPLAEHSGLITDIGSWVLTQACEDRSRWEGHGLPPGFRVNVNVSVHQLMLPDFADTVAAILAATRTAPEAMTLELTESAFIQDGRQAFVVLTALKELRLSLALDDFGTGYSSLSYLSRFPVDIVKIDRSFVANLATDTVSSAIVSAVINLSHALDMTVVGEGVETAEQHELLTALGCDAYQGFHFARPMPAADVATMIAVSG